MEVESLDHALVNCRDVKTVWKEALKWWKTRQQVFSSVTKVINQDHNSVRNSKISEIRAAVWWTFLYFIWTHRNQIVFKEDKRNVADLFLDFQRRSFEWISKRVRDKILDWAVWLSSPEDILR